MKESNTRDIMYLDVHNYIVFFPGYATHLIQTDYTSLQKKPYTLQNLVMKAKSITRAENASILYCPKCVHLTLWEPLLSGVR